MKFFIDTADINEIKDLAATGLVDGVTTNPSLVAKSGGKFLDVIKQICEVVEGPVSAEVTATDHKTMLQEGQKLAARLPRPEPGKRAGRGPARSGVVESAGERRDGAVAVRGQSVGGVASNGRAGIREGLEQQLEPLRLGRSGAQERDRFGAHGRHLMLGQTLRRQGDRAQGRGADLA